MATARQTKQFKIPPQGNSQEKLKTALQLLREVSQEELDSAHSTVTESFHNAEKQIQEISNEAAERTRQIVDQIQIQLDKNRQEFEHRIAQHPWYALGFAGLAGFMLGYSLYHRRPSNWPNP